MKKCSSLKTILSTLFLLCLLSQSTWAQKTTVEFARYPDGTALQMDIYQPLVKSDTPHVCVVFAFGGGFFTGRRDANSYLPFFQFLADKGYTVASIDCRLGLKGLKKAPSLFNRKPLINAIDLAVQDVFAATQYLLQHAGSLHIDTSKIVLSGSSAGAIAALQSEYQKRNNSKHAQLLPTGFQYAGVVSFAGAIYSTEGKPDYKIAPAPALFFHGNKDNIVPYKKIGLFGTGMYGSQSLANKRKKEGFPYALYTYEGIRHDVAAFPMRENQAEVHQFIQEYVVKKRPLFIDVNIRDANRKNRLNGSLQDAMRSQNQRR